ncbi:MAG: DNA pilot protein [Microviridae sp.]|nr:MAG: DNA pilot protein [Microviridae sp.]
MPADPNTIAAVADGINQVANVTATVGTNRKQNKWAQETYDKQRKDSLHDWSMQNAYNSPAAQMQRLKDAGLNPNLVYGNGADAQSTAMPRSVDTPNVKYEAPKLETMQAQNSLGNYYDAQIKGATIDNLQVQKTVLLEDAKFKAAQTLATLQDTEASKFDLGVKSDLRSTTIEAARQNLNKLLAQKSKIEADTVYTRDENKRKQQLQPNVVQEGLQRIALSKLQQAKTIAETKKIEQETTNLSKEEVIKQIEVDLRKQGLTPQSPFWLKKLNEAWEKYKNWLNPLPIKK